MGMASPTFPPAVSWSMLQTRDTGEKCLVWGNTQIDVLCSGTTEPAKHIPSYFLVLTNWGSLYLFHSKDDSHPLNTCRISPSRVAIGPQQIVVVAFRTVTNAYNDKLSGEPVWVITLPQHETQSWVNAVATMCLDTLKQMSSPQFLMQCNSFQSQQLHGQTRLNMSYNDFSSRPLPLFLDSNLPTNGNKQRIEACSRADRSHREEVTVSVNTREREFRNIVSICDTGILNDRGLRQSFRNSHFRTTIWQLISGLLPSDYATWVKGITQRRLAYDQVRSSTLLNSDRVRDILIRGFQQLNCMTENVIQLDQVLKLDESFCTVWQKYERGRRIMEQVWADVERTKKGSALFHDAKMLTILSNILVLWTDTHSEIGYVQGMNEIVARIIETVFKDYTAEQGIYHVLSSLQKAKLNGENQSNIHSTTLACIQNSSFIEHDSFEIFRMVLSGAKTLFQDTNVEDRDTPSYTSTVVSRARFVMDVLLRQSNNVLYETLQQCQVNPLTFLVPWMRLLFVRLITSFDVLIFWDALLCTDHKNLELLSFLCVSILCSNKVSNQVLEFARTNHEDAGMLIMKYLTQPICIEVNELLRIVKNANEVYMRYNIRSTAPCKGGSGVVRKKDSAPTIDDLDPIEYIVL